MSWEKIGSDFIFKPNHAFIIYGAMFVAIYLLAIWDERERQKEAIAEIDNREPYFYHMTDDDIISQFEREVKLAKENEDLISEELKGEL